MPRTHDLLFGPWRALPVLGVTQILAWGALFYPPVLTVPLIAADHGWSVAFTMGGFSAALLAGGLIAPAIGRMIDLHGGHVVMTAGSLAGATGLCALTLAQHPLAYIAAWMLIGAAMAASLYDPAFATLGRIFGAAARRPITLLTFVGGFASTVSWPATHILLEALGWRGTYLVYAALLVLLAAPLHALALPRERVDSDSNEPAMMRSYGPLLPPHGLTFALVAAGFAAYAFIPSGLSAHLLAIFARAGIDAATVVTIGALFGPSQVAARVVEFVFAGREHPLNLLRFALGLVVAAFALLHVLGIATPVAAAFAVMFGVCNGLVTIGRGALPLALFGAAGYGHVMGRIAGPWLVMQAAAPLVLAFVAERFSDQAALALAAAFALTALVCFVMIRPPRA